MQRRIVEEDLARIAGERLPWDMLEGKHVLVSGANGFLPAYMVETILYLNESRFKKKATVFALVRNKEKAEKRFAHYAGSGDLKFLVQDVVEPVKAKAKADFVVHAASQASPKYYALDPVGTINANVIGTHNLLEFAHKSKAERFLFFSSGEVYGNVGERSGKLDENDYGLLDPTDVRSCYGEGKRAGETMCVSYWKQFGVPARMVRPFHTYGPGMKLDDGRVFADFVSDVVGGRDIRMKSDGSAVRTFCYLSDAVAGFFTVLLKGGSGQAYNVSNPEGTISIYELAKLVVGLYPEKRLKVVREKEPDSSAYLKSKLAGFVPDVGKLEGLGWKPTVSLKEGFRRTIESYG